MDQYSHDDPLSKGNPLGIFLDLQTTILMTKDPNRTGTKKKEKKRKQATKHKKKRKNKKKQEDIKQEQFRRQQDCLKFTVYSWLCWGIIYFVCVSK